jgi:hypothetical protein
MPNNRRAMYLQKVLFLLVTDRQCGPKKPHDFRAVDAGLCEEREQQLNAADVEKHCCELLIDLHAHWAQDRGPCEDERGKAEKNCGTLTFVGLVVERAMDFKVRLDRHSLVY